VEGQESLLAHKRNTLNARRLFLRECGSQSSPLLTCLHANELDSFYKRQWLTFLFSDWLVKTSVIHYVYY